MKKTLAILTATAAIAALSPAAPVMAALSATPPVSTPPVSTVAEAERLTWGKCSDKTLPAPTECATIEVPVNWAKPDGKKIRLDLARLPATEPGRRIGSVLEVTGGPGASGIQFVKVAASNLKELGRRFDLVFFQTRTSLWFKSMPKVCLKPGTELQDPRSRKRHTAQTAAMTKAFLACQKADTTGLFAHVDSMSMARDMEAIRAALGEEQLSLLAQSYGGVPSIAYARLFPQRIRALYVDGVINQAAGFNDQGLRVVAAFEKQFQKFVAWCADTPACALHGEDAGAVWRALVREADRKPIPATSPYFGKGEMTGWALRLFAFPAVLPGEGNANWLAFAKSVDKARRGDGSGFGDPVVTGVLSWSSPGVLAMSCGDGRGFADYDDLRTYRRAAEKNRPNLGSVRIEGVACTGWPLKVANPVRPLPSHGLPPILGAGGMSLDVETTRTLTDMIPGSVTVTYEGPGHVLWGMGKKCVIKHLTAYLTDLKLPPPGTTCPAE
ncbi:alpha/beta fold hydrolase [Nonomuraea longicatena]|uniref:Alpha/beta hydrolase n=1 Tax=Nonomuraea longicatena TaxID=83682 RepID=A0ABP3Z7R2_9ACTN